MNIIQKANETRTTHATNVNDVSSRTHVVFRLTFRMANEENGQLTLLDLAGSERNKDSFYHSKERQWETIEINTSHMALKQCVRALVGQSDLKQLGYTDSCFKRLSLVSEF